MGKYIVAYSACDSGVSLRIVEAASALEAVQKDYEPPPAMDRSWWDIFCIQATNHDMTVHDLTGRVHDGMSFYHNHAERWCAAVKIRGNEDLTVFCAGDYRIEDSKWKITMIILPEVQLHNVTLIKKGEVFRTAQATT